MVSNFVNLITSITDDIQDEMIVLFDEVNVDGETIYTPCPELLRFVQIYQVSYYTN